MKLKSCSIFMLWFPSSPRVSWGEKWIIIGSGVFSHLTLVFVFILTCGLHQLRVQAVGDQRVGQVRKESLQRSGSSVHRHVHRHKVDAVIYKSKQRAGSHVILFQLQSAALFIRKPAPPGQSIWITRI